jgi:hypothetical protein
MGESAASKPVKIKSRYTGGKCGRVFAESFNSVMLLSSCLKKSVTSATSATALLTGIPQMNPDFV